MESTKSFLLADHQKTLFPLDTTRILVENHSEAIAKYIYEKIASSEATDHCFLPQIKTYASKPKLHLRRTLKLDPIAEYFLYDFALRNRTQFKKDFRSNRRSYGYRFENGDPISATAAYFQYKSDVRELSSQFRYCLKFDVSTYFNSIYHHDLISWAAQSGIDESDVAIFDRFLKQINSGRSIDCLPQGLYPAKMIGSHFLKFVDNSARLKSDHLLRFMDDFILFSNDSSAISADFQTIQILLGEKGLSVNSGKTSFGLIEALSFERQIDTIKKSLLIKRQRYLTDVSPDEFDDPEELDEPRKLDEAEEEYLLNLLNSDNLEEEDAELALKLMREDSDKVLGFLEKILTKFPNLSKSIYYFCSSLDQPEQIAEILLRVLRAEEKLSESQLFWIARIAESYLSKTKQYGEILMGCYDHPDSTTISKAKVLEIPERRFGLLELRELNLRTGSSGWTAWCSAVGMLSEKKVSRNHMLAYFGNASPTNRLIRECLEKL